MRIGVKVYLYNHKLYNARKNAGLTQAQLAEIIGIPTSYYSSIEGLKLPTLDYGKMHNTLLDIADLLKINMQELFPADYLYAVQERLLPRVGDLIRFRIEGEVDKLDDFYQAQKALSNSLEESVEILDAAKTVNNAISLYLDPREQEALSLYYGLNGCNESTYREVAKKMGVSTERVRQIVFHAQRKLFHPKTGLRDLL